MDSDSIIFIIISIIILLVSALGSKRKKGQGRQTAPVGRLLDQLAGEGEEEEPEQMEYEKESPRDQIRKKTAEQPLPGKAGYKPEKMEETRHFEQQVPETVAPSIDIDSLLKDFDPQKAVIYSEILNRKYF